MIDTPDLEIEGAYWRSEMLAYTENSKAALHQRCANSCWSMSSTSSKLKQ
jgi:hypothetical protein